jgi:hypothetical protein
VRPDHGRHVGPIEVLAAQSLEPGHFLLVLGIQAGREGLAHRVSGGRQLLLHPVVVGHHSLPKLLDRLITGLALRQLPQPHLHDIGAGRHPDERHVRADVGAGLGGHGTRRCDRWVLRYRRVLRRVVGDYPGIDAHLGGDLGCHVEMALQHRQSGGDDLTALGGARRLALALERGDIFLMMPHHCRHILPIELRAGQLLQPLDFLLVVVRHSGLELSVTLRDRGGQLVLEIRVVSHHLLAELPDRAIGGPALCHLAQPNFHEVARGGVENEPAVLP